MKLHLPKVLFTAVVAAVCCVQQTMAADYSVYTSTAITDPETSEVITPAYGYTIIQWTGGTTGTAGSGLNKLQGIFYGPWKTATYNATNGSLTVGNAYSGAFDAAFTKDNWNTLMLDASNSAGANATVQYDAAPLKISGLIVTSDSNINTLKANGNSRQTFIGKEGGPTGYTTIDKNFTFDLSGSTLTLAGTQVWNISDGVTFTIKDTGTFTNSGSLTVNGTLKLGKTLSNGENAELTLNDGLRFNSATITRESKGGDLQHETHGFRVGETVYTLATGNGTINLGENFKLYMDDSSTALGASGISNQNGTLTYTGQGRNTIYEITSAHTDVVEYGDGIEATAGATGFLMEAGTKLALKTTATFNDKITVTGADANIAVHEGVTLNSSNLATTGEGSVIVGVNKGTLAINEQNPTANFKEINLTNGATLSVNDARSRLGSENAKVAINMSGKSIIYLQNGNGDSGPIWADIQTEGTNYIQGAVYGGNAVIKGTIKGSGTLGLARHNGWGNAWKIESLISDAEGEQLQLKISGADIENGEMVEADGQKQDGNPQINNVTLSGANTYSGGTEIFGATVTAANASALGKGKVTMKSGTLQQSTDLTVSAMEYQGGTVTNSGKALTVTGALDAKTTMSIGGAGDVSIGSLNLADGTTLSTEGDLTLGSLTLNLNSYAFDQVHTLVSSSGTLDFKGSLADYNQQKVGDYITKVEVSNSSIVLTFKAAPESLSLEVGQASISGNVLTLNIDANLTDVSELDLTLSAAALASIEGKFGLVSLELIANDGTFYTVGDSNVISNVSFYNGAYTGESAGMYRVEYIPEPTTATLSLLALAGLAARRRRK